MPLCPYTGGVQTKGLESDSVAVAEARRSVMALLLHGDAAFAGQGVVAEMLQLANIPGEVLNSRSTPDRGSWACCFRHAILEQLHILLRPCHAVRSGSLGHEQIE